MAILGHLLYRLYSLFWFCALPFANLYLNKRVKKGKELQERLSERFGIYSFARPHPGHPILVIHGASVGESLSVLPLIDFILAHNPDLYILLTTNTVSSYNLLKTRVPARVFHAFSPLDHSEWIKRFFQFWQPIGILCLESEIWPTYFKIAHKNQIPLILLNARLSDDSFRIWSFFSFALTHILKHCDAIFAQSKLNRERYLSFGLPHVEEQVNLKYSVSTLTYDQNLMNHLSTKIQLHPTVLFSSTHEGEERLACQMHKNLKKKFRQLITFIAPRHPTRCHEIEEELSRHGLSYQKTSLWGNDIDLQDTDIVIIDQLGVLGLYYKLIPLVVMGGSFANKGGHNPIEPALFFACVIMGPHRHNFLQICEEFMQQNAIICLDKQEDLLEKLTQLLLNPQLQQEIGKRAGRFVQTQQNQLPVLYERIKAVINEKSKRTVLL